MLIMNRRNFGTSSRLILAGTLLLNAIALYKWARPLYETDSLFISRKWIFIIGSTLLGLVISSGLLAASWTPLWNKITAAFAYGMRQLRRLGKINLILFLLVIAVYSFMVLGRYGVYLTNNWVRLFVVWLVVLAGAVFLRAAGFDKSWEELLAGALLIAMLGFKMATFSGDISTYPFSLDWSEASRYYYASLFFSRQIYGIAVPSSVLHPTRYLLQSPVFPPPMAGYPVGSNHPGDLYPVRTQAGDSGSPTTLDADRLGFSFPASGPGLLSPVGPGCPGTVGI
jgi:hypothetical protein